MQSHNLMRVIYISSLLLIIGCGEGGNSSPPNSSLDTNISSSNLDTNHSIDNIAQETTAITNSSNEEPLPPHQISSNFDKNISNTDIINSTSTDNNSSISLPNGYIYPVINNQNIAVKGEVDSYIVKLYSNKKEQADAQSRHQGVVIKFNGHTSETLPIQSTYIGKKVIVALYNSIGELIKVSKEVTVTDNSPIFFIEI